MGEVCGLWSISLAVACQICFFVTLHVLLFRYVFVSSVNLVEVSSVKRDHDISNRTVSIVHAVVCSIAAALILWLLPTPFGAKLIREQQLIFTWSMAYFIYDLVYSTLTSDWETVFHHCTTVSGLWVAFAHSVSGTEILIGLVITEVSTPLLHSRQLIKRSRDRLKASGVNDPPKVKNLQIQLDRLSIAFAAVFIVARCFMGPILTYYTVMCKTTPIFVKLGAIAVQVVSCFWATKILMAASRSIKTKRN